VGITEVLPETGEVGHQLGQAGRAQHRGPDGQIGQHGAADLNSRDGLQLLDSAGWAVPAAPRRWDVDDPRFVEEPPQGVDAGQMTFPHRRRHQRRARQPGLDPVQILRRQLLW